MVITLTRSEVLGMVAQAIQRDYNVAPATVVLVEIYGDKSGKGELQAEVVVEATITR